MSSASNARGLLPLRLEAISFRHQGQSLLEDVDLHISTSGKTLVLGPNGAGKSLLLRLCHGLIAPSSGTVRWALDGPAGRIQRGQAMVFQRPVLLRRSALANVLHALALHEVPRAERKERAAEALDHFGLLALAKRSARVMSGGEQQRLALARAWALKPEILFLDEPTSALDPAAVKAVEDAVLAFHAVGTRIVMTTHDLGQARRLADEVVFLCRGRVIEQSPAEQFFGQPQSAEAAAFLRGDLVW